MKSEISVCTAIMLNDHSNADNYRVLPYSAIQIYHAVSGTLPPNNYTHYALSNAIYIILTFRVCERFVIIVLWIIQEGAKQ